jgi:hypothetical protein
VTSCSKKRSLLLIWQAATQAYSEAVSELATKVVSAISSDEYEMLNKQVDRTRNRTADTRNVFELHVEEHGC